ncbi:MAG: hypothetical protein HQL96_14420 [Magnetococcales bacterium]|nr:hypothetical protein [Magnetococcales bacterium]
MIPSLSLFILIFVMFFPSAGGSEEGIFVRDRGFSIELKALSLDATDAFFLARGWDGAATGWLAENGCFYKLATVHDGGEEEQAVAVDLTTWRVRSANGAWQQLAFKETWASFLEERQVPQPARTAFHWAVFPTHQTFHPGDRMWGMVPMGFMPGTRFDLQAVWFVGDKRSETVLTNLRCAPPRTTP